MPNIHDVARRAGVSPVTVSRVVNRAPNVNAETRTRVELAIRELGYLPNQAARSLRARQTRTLALIVPDITNAFWTTVARGVEDAAQSEGYSVLLCNTDEDPEKQTNYLETVLRQRVDGVILAPCDADLARLARLPEQNTPAVLMDRRVPGWTGDTISCDSLAASCALTAHLIGLGRRRIAVVSGPPGASTADDRIAGYAQALRQAGLAFDESLVRRGEYRAHSGYDMAGDLLDGDTRPDAFLAANNVLAMGVLEALHERGLHVPRDAALVCFDDLPDLAHFYPFLSVAAQPAYDIGLNAAQLVLSRIDASGPLQPRHVILPVRLVLRYSCGRFLDHSAPGEDGMLALPERTDIRLVTGPTHERSASSAHARGTLERAINGQPTGRMAFFELDFPGRAVLEYVLQRNLNQPLDAWRVDPADWAAYARQAGVDAIPCQLYAPDLDDLPPVNSLLNRLEEYLRAAQGSGVGVYALLTPPARVWRSGAELNRLLEQVRVIVDRFGGELAMLMLDGLNESDAADGKLAKVLAPVREHGLTAALRLEDGSSALLDLAVEAGVRVIAGGNRVLEDWQAVRKAASGRLVWTGELDVGSLARVERGSVRSQVWEACAALARGGDSIFAVSMAQGQALSPEGYLQMIQAVRDYAG